MIILDCSKFLALCVKRPRATCLVALPEMCQGHQFHLMYGLRLPDGMRRPVSAGCDTLPMFDVLKAQ